MTREHKISLILGFAVALIVGVMVSDHLSKARQTPLGAAEENALAGADQVAQPISAVSEPSLVLVDERGRPEPLEQIAATPLPDAEAGADGPAVASADASGFEWLRDQVSGAVNDLKNGHTPPAAVQTDAPATLVMGHPSIGPADHPDARPTPNRSAPVLSPPSPPNAQSFVLYTVKPGDSLWKLAEQHLGDGHRHTELAELNRDRIGKDGSLRVGASIKIPRSGHGTDRVSEIPASKPAFVADPPKSAKTYTVQAGDTLGEISQRMLGTSKRIADIVSANRDQIEDADDIRVGMVLKIPSR